jgi:hypothetical protein
MEMTIWRRRHISHIGATVQQTPAKQGGISLLGSSAFYMTNDIMKSDYFHLLPDQQLMAVIDPQLLEASDRQLPEQSTNTTDKHDDVDFSWGLNILTYLYKIMDDAADDYATLEAVQDVFLDNLASEITDSNDRAWTSMDPRPFVLALSRYNIVANSSIPGGKNTTPEQFSKFRLFRKFKRPTLAYALELPTQRAWMRLYRSHTYDG